MKASEHLWILMLAQVSLSEVLARVCLKTWDISTILLPGGAKWVLRAILALFMAPSTSMQSKKWRQTGGERMMTAKKHSTYTATHTMPHSWLSMIFPSETKSQNYFQIVKKLQCKKSFQKILGYLVEPRPVSCLSAGRQSSQRGWVWGCAGGTRVACAGGRSGWVWSSQLVSGADLWSVACGQAGQLCRGKLSPPRADPSSAQPPGISGKTQLENQLQCIIRCEW